MKRLLILAFSVFICAQICACSDSQGPFRPGEQWGIGLKFDEETALKKLIVRDVLGGVLSVSVDPNVILPPPAPTEEMSAISINASYPAEDKTVQETYVFKDEENRDALKIVAEGNKEEISTAGGERVVIKFSPLKLKFEFDQFVFTNACGFMAYLDGKMECRLNGKYNKIDETFTGSGSCSAGATNNVPDLIYVFQDQEERAVRISVNVYVDGDFFNMESYRFTGSFNVDNRLMTVDNSFNEEQICTPLAERR